MTRAERIRNIQEKSLRGFTPRFDDREWLLSELEKADAEIANLRARALPKTEEG